MLSNKQLQVDIQNIDHGYFVACSSKKAKKLKLQVLHRDSLAYLYYDLNGKKEYETFPLQLGNGEYMVTLYKQVIGTKYVNVGSVKFKVNILDENEVYVHYNQYVQEDVELTEIAKGLYMNGNDIETFWNVREYIKNNFAYDYVRAIKAKGNNFLPDIFMCLEKKMGTCQDLAVLVASMFRSIGIPAKLMIGYADKKYHAWVSVLIGGKWKLYDPTVEVGAMKKPKNYSIERWY